ncbi:MAG: SIR2 family protein [Planctomycetota bacterium]
MNITPAQLAPARKLAKKLVTQKDAFVDSTVAERAGNWIEEFSDEVTNKEAGWRDLATFWPPRCVEAFCDNRATVFFGAGVSFPAGFPSWSALLVDYFQLDRALVEDEDVKNDPLTLAELAGQVIGNESLQQRLREVFSVDTKPTTSHRLLAELACKVYVTTNYDALFEKAFFAAKGIKPFVATNDTHLPEAMKIIGDRKDPRPVIFKIHGCVSLPSEHLILTRRDYRHHYRANDKFFKQIITFLIERHTLFVGFSHRDPEVSRLVDDAIHEFENNPNRRSAPWPQLYSLQFDMRAHTPEIFAARGIVALTPPPPRIDWDPKATRSQALAAGLCDLLLAKTLQFHTNPQTRLDVDLSQVVKQLESPLQDSLKKLSAREAKALAAIAAGKVSLWFDQLRADLQEFASQGLFLANENGQIVAASFPNGMSASRATTISTVGVQERPYFQIANTFRKAFVSDLTESIFNQQGTFFLCQPLLKNDRFTGLLFSASQIGQWKLPIALAQQSWKAKRGFILVDSNGVCLLPSFNEFQPDSVGVDAQEDKTPALNEGYSFKELLGLSRRDQLIRHIAKSVVPVQQDDDVLVLAKDAGYYTVVSELTDTRWKVALSMPMKR